MSDSNFGKQLKTGVFFTFISKYSNIVINILITAVLARLLSPDEFGIVAVVTVFTTFFNLISQMGIGPAVIQNKELNEKDVSNIFKFMCIIAILMGFFFFGFSYAIAAFYKDSVYIRIGQILSLSVMFNTLNTVPKALLSKAKKFKTIAVISVSTALVSGVFAIILAVLGFSYYSIVLKSVMLAFSAFVITFIASKIKVMKGFSLSSAKVLRGYASFQFLFSFINYFSRNLDNILIGRFMGASALGYYDKAYKLMMYPVQNLTHTITPVLHPLLSDFQNNKDKIFNVYKKITKFLALIGVPICVMLYFYAHEIIWVFYGEQWLPVVPAFKILSISIIIQIILSSSGSIFQSAGRTDLLFLSGLISAVTMVTGISFGVYMDRLESVATGILIAMVFNFFQSFYILINRALNKSLLDFLWNYNTSAAIGIIMILSNLFVIQHINIGHELINLIVGGAINGAIWLVMIFVFKEHKIILNIKNMKS